jgi:phage shock protein A
LAGVENKQLQQTAEARQDDELVRALLTEIHKLAGLYSVTSSAMDQFKDKIQQLEVEKELLEVQVRQVRCLPNQSTVMMSRTTMLMGF